MRSRCRNVRAGVGVSGVGKFISSKVLRLWNFAKNDHKNVKLAHQPLENTPPASLPTNSALNHILVFLQLRIFLFSVADKGEPEGEQRPSQL